MASFYVSLVLQLSRPAAYADGGSGSTIFQ